MGLGEILFGIDGRAPRRAYWLCLLLTLIVTLIYLIFAAVITGGRFIALTLGSYSADFYRGNLPSLGWVLVSTPIYVFSLLFFLSIAIRRLHDRNKSARWLYLFVLLPWVLDQISGFVIALAGDPLRIGTAFGLVALAIELWAFVELGFLRGTVGENQYGPDPLEPEDQVFPSATA